MPKSSFTVINNKSKLFFYYCFPVSFHSFFLSISHTYSTCSILILLDLPYLLYWFLQNISHKSDLFEAVFKKQKINFTALYSFPACRSMVTANGVMLCVTLSFLFHWLYPWLSIRTFVLLSIAVQSSKCHPSSLVFLQNHVSLGPVSRLVTYSRVWVSIDIFAF